MQFVVIVAVLLALALGLLTALDHIRAKEAVAEAQSVLARALRRLAKHDARMDDLAQASADLQEQVGVSEPLDSPSAN